MVQKRTWQRCCPISVSPHNGNFRLQQEFPLCCKIDVSPLKSAWQSRRRCAGPSARSLLRPPHSLRQYKTPVRCRNIGGPPPSGDAGDNILATILMELLHIVRFTDKGTACGHQIHLPLSQPLFRQIRVLKATDGSHHNLCAALFDRFCYRQRHRRTGGVEGGGMGFVSIATANLENVNFSFCQLCKCNGKLLRFCLFCSTCGLASCSNIAPCCLMRQYIGEALPAFSASPKL